MFVKRYRLALISLPDRPRTSGLTDLSRGGKWIGLVDSRLSALQRILVT
jgi:hypothetical protein